VSTKLFVGQNGGFFEAIRALSNFNVNVSLGVKVSLGKCIFVDECWGEIFTMNSHVLKNFHV
jgi:hypothetical protein